MAQRGLPRRGGAPGAGRRHPERDGDATWRLAASGSADEPHGRRPTGQSIGDASVDHHAASAAERGDTGIEEHDFYSTEDDSDRDFEAEVD